MRLTNEQKNRLCELESGFVNNILNDLEMLELQHLMHYSYDQEEFENLITNICQQGNNTKR